MTHRRNQQRFAVLRLAILPEKAWFARGEGASTTNATLHASTLPLRRPKEGADFLQKLMGIWKIKLTGKIPALKRGVLQFLGRTIYRERDGESSLSLGVSEAYMVGIIDNWHEKLKPTETPPKLEEIYKDREKQGDDQPLTAEGEARYRRVLGQLAWAALSRADLCFSVSYLARFQSKPTAYTKTRINPFLVEIRNKVL